MEVDAVAAPSSNKKKKKRKHKAEDTAVDTTEEQTTELQVGQLPSNLYFENVFSFFVSWVMTEQDFRTA